MVARFIPPGQRLHVRRIFYACVAAGNVRKPSGARFVNDASNEAVIAEASQYARWFGLIDRDRFVDNKNDDPVIQLRPNVNPEGNVVSYGPGVIDELDAGDIDIAADLDGFVVRQPYKLIFFGEKTSLEDVLGRSLRN
jgi:hypothetical protein